MARRRGANAELEALRASVALVRDLILGDIGRSSSLVASLPKAVKEVENRINMMANNGVQWGTRSALVAILLHFRELEPKLELLGSGRDAYLIEDQADALWPLVSTASNSLASLIPSSLARNPPDDAE
jgi:hypothetical protein